MACSASFAFSLPPQALEASLRGELAGLRGALSGSEGEVADREAQLAQLQVCPKFLI